MSRYPMGWMWQWTEAFGKLEHNFPLLEINQRVKSFQTSRARTQAPWFYPRIYSPPYVTNSYFDSSYNVVWSRPKTQIFGYNFVN